MERPTEFAVFPKNFGKFEEIFVGILKILSVLKNFG